MKKKGGIMNLKKKEFKDIIKKIGIGVKKVENKKIFKVEDQKNLRGEIKGGNKKKILIKEKKDNLFMVKVEEDEVVEIKQIKKIIGEERRV